MRRGWLWLLAVPLLPELLFRAIDPATNLPRVSFRRMATVQWRAGVPLWSALPLDQVDALENASCQGSFHIAIVGRAFLARETEHRDPARIGDVVTEILGKRGWKTCVHAYGGEGWTAAQSFAAAQTAPASDLVLLQIDGDAPFDWTIAGGAAWNFNHVVTDGSGLPNPFGVPAPLHRATFAVSRLYQWAVDRNIERNVTIEPRWRALADERLEDLKDRIDPADLVPVFVPELNVPFGHARDRRGRGWEEDPYRGYALVDAWARRAKVRTVWLEDALQQHDVGNVADGCCAFNELGRRTVAEVFANQALTTRAERR